MVFSYWLMVIESIHYFCEKNEKLSIMKYIIFDIDGTLADTKDIDDKCFVAAFYQSFGINIVNENWAALQNVTDWGITEEIIEREWGRSPSEQEYEKMRSELVTLLLEANKNQPRHFTEVAGAKAFFEHLSGLQNYRLGIATGAWGDSAKIKLGAIGIDWSSVCFSNSDHFKTRDSITNSVIRQLDAFGEQPKQIIYFGDGEWDYTTCKKMGIEFIGIDVRANGKLEKLGAKYVFRDFTAPEKIMQLIKDL